MNIHILDCTLRDGGYVNNWDFNKEEYDKVIRSLSEAGLEYIEVGIMGNDKSSIFNTKFSHYEEIPKLTKKGNSCYTVMTTVGEAESIPVPEREKDTVDAIRVAFFKPDIEKALHLADRIKGKGYQVFFQAMATYMYSRSELEDLMVKAQKVEADAFYMVDSFGTLYPEDVREMVRMINATLASNIPVGFHAHNNIQLAFANDIAFLEAMNLSGREVVMIDGTVYGMGRGAGNTPLELLTDYLNKHYDGNYDTKKIMEVYLSVVRSKYREQKWGYDYLYYITSKYKVNMAYVWYLKEIKGIKDEEIISDIIRKLPNEEGYTLNKELADELVEAIQNGCGEITD